METKDIILELTSKGQTLMAKIQAGAGTVPLEITRIVSGSGTSSDPLNLNAVVDEQQAFKINNSTSEGERTIIEVELSNLGDSANEPPIPPLTVGFSISQIGIYALDPDDGEILMRITQLVKPIWIPPATRPMIYSPTLEIITANASEVIIEISPDAPVTLDMFNNHVSDNAAHGADLHASALTIMLRDSEGRAQANIPVDDLDVVNKKYLDAEIGSLIGFHLLGPYVTTDDVPTPYQQNAIYLVGLAPPYQMFANIEGVLTPIGIMDAKIPDKVPIANGGTGLVRTTSRIDNAPLQITPIMTAGSANAYTLSLTPDITAYTVGMQLYVTFFAANTSTTPTLSVSGMGSRTLRNADNTALTVGEISANSTWLCEIFSDSIRLLEEHTDNPIFTTSGSGSAYTLSPIPAWNSYAAGSEVVVRFHTATAATTPTINISGLGARTLRNSTGGLLTTGALSGENWRAWVNTDGEIWLVEQIQLPELTYTDPVTNIYTLDYIEGFGFHAVNRRLLVQFHAENTAGNLRPINNVFQSVSLQIQGVDGERRIYSQRNINPDVGAISADSVWSLQDNGNGFELRVQASRDANFLMSGEGLRIVTGIMTSNGAVNLGVQPKAVFVFASEITGEISSASVQTHGPGRLIAMAIPERGQTVGLPGNANDRAVVLAITATGFTTSNMLGRGVSSAANLPSVEQPLRYLAFI
jgi:hypothetical protein